MFSRRRYISIFLLIFIATTTANSQSRSFDCAVPAPQKAAKHTQDLELIRKIQSTYSTVNSLEAVFDQESYLAALDITEGSTGSLYFKRPGKIRWDYKSPEPQTFLLSDDTVYLYQPSEKQLIIDTMKEVLLSEVPVAFIMGVGELEKDFTHTNTCKNANGTVLSLKPKKEQTEIAELKLLINETTYYPLGGKVTDNSGNVTSVVFSDSKTNTLTNNDKFKPDFPKGIDVNDRRQK